MEIDLYLIIFMLCNILKTYILYRYFALFFKNRNVSNQIEFITYLIFFLVNSGVYMFVNLPMVMLVVNIFGRYLLTYNYQGQQKNRIFLTLFFCIMAMLIETFIVFISTKVSINILEKSTYTLIQGPIFTTIFLYLFVLILGKWKNADKQLNMPLSYWIMLLLIPLSSLFIILIIMIYGELTIDGMAICSILFLLINISAFNLYDKILGYVSKKMENRFLAQQNIYYNNLLENIKASNESTHALKHDMKNHVIAMEALLKRKEYDQLSQYLKSTFHSVLMDKTFISTGNITIDSILNYKIKEAKNKNIKIVTDIAIPSELKLPSEMLTIILGNLLDNAIESTSKDIELKMIYDRRCLFISISNPYEKDLKKSNHNFITTKRNKECHGYGLNNIKRMVGKNQGNIKIDESNQEFTVKIVLYDKESYQ